MVVEDSPVQRAHAVALCRQLGIELIYEACDGAEALLQLGMLQLKPDLMLIDLHMPVMDGVELITHMHERGWKIPMLVVSSQQQSILNAVQELSSTLGLGIALGVAVIVADVALRNSGKGALPPLAVGLGIYLPPTIGMTLVLGALLGWLIQRAIRRHGQRNGKEWVAAAEERGLLLASGLIVGESLMGLALAAAIGFSGNDAPLALVSDFAPAMWLGLLAFAALFAFFYRRVVGR